MVVYYFWVFVFVLYGLLFVLMLVDFTGLLLVMILWIRLLVLLYGWFNLLICWFGCAGCFVYVCFGVITLLFILDVCLVICCLLKL